MDDRTEPKIPKFRCFGNFSSVRFGSVRLKNTEPKQIEEFRFNNKLKLHIGSEISVDDRTEPKIPKFRCFGNFGSVRFGSVRLEKTELKQIAEFRFKKYTNYTVG